MKPDTIIYGGLAGVIGTAAKEIIDYISYSIGWSKHLYWHLAASVFVLPTEVTKPGALILGALADTITGASYGIILLYLIRLTGKDYLYLKGMGLGWFIWLSLFGVFINFHVVRITPTDIASSLSAFVEHTVFGLAAAWFLGKYGQKAIVKS